MFLSERASGVNSVRKRNRRRVATQPASVLKAERFYVAHASLFLGEAVLGSRRSVKSRAGGCVVVVWGASTDIRAATQQGQESNKPRRIEEAEQRNKKGSRKSRRASAAFGTCDRQALIPSS